MKMNFSNALAYIVICAFIYGIVTKLTDNPKIFLNLEGMVVIGVGIILATSASFPWSALVDTGHSLKRAFMEPVRVPTDEARQCVRLALVAQRGLARLEGELDFLNNQFLRQGTELILEGVKPDVFVSIMHKRINEYQERISRCSNVVMTMSKFSPSLGLAATVLGLVGLLDKLGTADLAVLGGAMATALASTFYGIILANLFFQPLAELMQTRGEEEIKTREMILDGLHSVLERREPLVVGEVVNSYIPDFSRVKFVEEMEELSKERTGSTTTRQAAAA